MRISNSKLVCLLANNRFLPVKCFSASSSMSSSASVLSASQKNNIPINLKKHDVEILSEDPSCFLVHNFLSPEECKAYISKADDTGRRALMTRSNAPQVSLQLEKLWPLPLFCLGAGIPPVLRLLEDSSNNNGVPSTGAAVVGIGDVVNAALPSVSIAFGVVAALVAAITKGMQKFAETSSRTSRSLALNAEGDCDFIRNLVDQASLITNHGWDRWEAPVITKYESGALFASHNDASVTRGSEWADLGGQRVVTVITYLNTCNQGGGTKFDKLGFQVQPRSGSALIFFPAIADTMEADGRTVHQSLPAVEEKYIVQLFGRVGRVPPPLGIPESYDM